MTIKQYQTLAKAIANRIIELGGNPRRVKHLGLDSSIALPVRDPHMYSDASSSYESGISNAIVECDRLSNPNNPNYKFRTLKPGSMSAYNSKSHVNVDLSDYNFDSAQFAKLVSIVNNNIDSWYN